MKLNLNRDFLQSTIPDFPNDIIQHFGFKEDVVKHFGEEHYQLLSSISMQCDNKKIMELGTHKGQSAVCLTYGNRCDKNITLNTYDICNLLFQESKEWFSKYNVHFHLEDLFNPEIREKNKDFILDQDIIFIDIDPHEGLLELDMYQWLKTNDYKGIVFFDDIHLGRGHMNSTVEHSMQEFWDKIENEYKTDLTKIGHWSGTGMVCFHPELHTITV
jgi:predicted O-methyltransferase YrrM